MERRYDKASERPEYAGSRLNCFHIILEEKGKEWVLNSTDNEHKAEMVKIGYRLSVTDRVVSDRFWSDEEKEYIMENHGSKTYTEMSEVINRSANAIKVKRFELKKLVK